MNALASVLCKVCVFVVSFAVGLSAAFPVFTLGLAVPGVVVLPLTLAVAAYMSALGAAWTANLFAAVRSAKGLRRIAVVAGGTTLLLIVASLVRIAFAVPLSDSFRLFSRDGLALASMLVLGPAVPGLVVVPVAAGIAAALGAFVAAWSGNLFGAGRSAIRLLHVVAITEATALLLIVASFVPVAVAGLFPWPFDIAPAFLAVLLGMVACPIVATVATWRLRAASVLRRDALLALGLVVGAKVVADGIVSLTCSLTPCMP